MALVTEFYESCKKGIKPEYEKILKRKITTDIDQSTLQRFESSGRKFNPRHAGLFSSLASPTTLQYSPPPKKR